MNIILDTDMGGDCDDVGALFILHGAVERGEAKLLATMGCISSDAIAPCLDAINTWFGRPGIPVGTLKDPGFLVGPHYTSEIARCFPHKFPSGKDYPDAVMLYRQLLAKQPDGSVVVVAIGPLRNLANLLKSRPDDASPSDGPTLVAKKVKRLDVMGGKYPPSASKKDGEWNFVQDAAAAALVCSAWPTPVLFNGEGGSTCSGRRVTYEMPEHNPLTMAYTAYPGVGFAGDRLSWDPISCLVAVRGATPWYKVVRGGVNVTDGTKGINTWQAGTDRGHSYLVLQSRKAEIEKALEDMMVAGKGRPTNLTFNTAYYAQAGMCQITSKGAADATTAAIKAFDRDDKTAWLDKAASSWIQCQYADGRKYVVTSYAVVCRDKQRLPRTFELSGSNDGGVGWTLLDTQQGPGFTEQTQRREFAIAKPAKWNIYRLSVTAASGTEGTQIASIELNEAINCRPNVAVATVTLDQQTLALPANSRATLNATLAPMETFEREVAWTSSDPAVAEVRRIGEQIAMVVGKKPGTCTVMAAIENLKQTCAVTVTPSALPTGWSYDELSAPAIPGAVSVADDSFTITGCGHAMTSWWERVRDQGVFVSQAVPGNVEIHARLTSLAPNVGGPAHQGDNRPPTASGLMIREALAQACGRYVLVQVEASGNLVCRWRNKTGDQDDNKKKDLGKVTLPIHLKLVQSAKDIQVFASTDGQNWGEPRMLHPAVFDDKSRIGIFVCSGNTFASTTALFDSVNVTR
ncbi:MAG: nucleoside hydrolase [Planctomycetota bacterium]|nr:nucleoside hydrolase [Planctomycetota bacterium]